MRPTSFYAGRLSIPWCEAFRKSMSVNNTKTKTKTQMKTSIFTLVLSPVATSQAFTSMLGAASPSLNKLHSKVQEMKITSGQPLAQNALGRATYFMLTVVAASYEAEHIRREFDLDALEKECLSMPLQTLWTEMMDKHVGFGWMVRWIAARHSVSITAAHRVQLLTLWATQYCQEYASSVSADYLNERLVDVDVQAREAEEAKALKERLQKEEEALKKRRQKEEEALKKRRQKEEEVQILKVIKQAEQDRLKNTNVAVIVSANLDPAKGAGGRLRWLVRLAHQDPADSVPVASVVLKDFEFTSSSVIEQGFGCSLVAKGRLVHTTIPDAKRRQLKFNYNRFICIDNEEPVSEGSLLILAASGTMRFDK